MKKINWLVAIATAFLSGYFLSELRHASDQDNRLGGQQIPASFEPSQSIIAGAQSSAASSENALPANAPAASSSVTLTGVAAISQQFATDKNITQAIGALKAYLSLHAKDTDAWLLLADIYRQDNQPTLAVDALFQSLKVDVDNAKAAKHLKLLKDYLLQLKQSPNAFKNDWHWLIAQLEELEKYDSSDPEMQLLMAQLALDIRDTYLAQYHALMALNQPSTKKRAEQILASLEGEKLPEQLKIALSRLGNQFVAEVVIENNPARMLLDTGASLSGLSKDYTAKYPHLLKSQKPIRLNTASGSVESMLFTVDNLSLGALNFNQHIFAQLPMSDAQGFDGLLGVDILGRFDFVIDQNATVLTLKARKKE